jgi:hypothetical protein
MVPQQTQLLLLAFFPWAFLLAWYHHPYSMDYNAQSFLWIPKFHICLTWLMLASFKEDFMLQLQWWKDNYGQKWVIFWDDTNVNPPDPFDADTNWALSLVLILLWKLCCKRCCLPTVVWVDGRLGTLVWLNIQFRLPVMGWHLCMSSWLCERMCHLLTCR